MFGKRKTSRIKTSITTSRVHADNTGKLYFGALTRRMSAQDASVWTVTETGEKIYKFRLDDGSWLEININE